MLENIEQVCTETFWKEFSPALHVFEVEFMESLRLFEIDTHFSEHASALLKKEGYFEIPFLKWNLPFDQMVKTVQKVKDLGLPTPFSFMYDEFWCLSLKLNKIVAALFPEERFWRLPDFWTWLIDPKNDESGWRPHRDKDYRTLFPDRSPKAVTIWIPLTASTPLNGCMYIVPADRDPTYATPQDYEQKFNLTDIRALPAQPGTVFCWTQAAFHWGSHSSPRAVEPRISVAFEYQSTTVPPLNQPVMNPYEVPDFAFRLKLIAKQILQYQHMYPLSQNIERLAQNILKG